VPEGVSPNANVLLHLLERSDPDNYAPPPKRVEQTGKDGGPVKAEVTVKDAVDGLSDDEVLRAAEGLLKGKSK
jgi:RecB family endonuclease NucS